MDTNKHKLNRESRFMKFDRMNRICRMGEDSEKIGGTIYFLNSNWSADYATQPSICMIQTKA
jgi:hypothetical protein